MLSDKMGSSSLVVTPKRQLAGPEGKLGKCCLKDRKLLCSSAVYLSSSAVYFSFFSADKPLHQE